MDRDDAVILYLQDRMSHADRAKFEAAMADDDLLRAQVAALTAARGVMDKEAHDVPADGWERLSAAIDSEKFRPANDNRFGRLGFLQAACVAAVSIIGWQFIAQPLFSGDGDNFEMVTAADERPIIQVRFANGASMTEISKVLYEVNGAIVDGPSAIGLYRIRFDGEAARQSAFEALNERGDLFEEVLNE